MQKIDKKIDKFLTKIQKKDLEKMIRPMVLVFLILVFSMVIYSQLVYFEVNRLNLNVSQDSSNYILENKIRSLVKGYPIEKMVNQIAKKDEILAAYLIGIAKKESNWGKRVPVLNGQDCFNYWGYRGIRDRMGTGGHTCFDSPRDAVNTVSKRIGYFVRKEGLKSPRDMVVWKCGRNCETHQNESVEKWINDVSYYYEKIVN